MANELGIVPAPRFRQSQGEHPFQRRIDLNHRAAIIQHHHALDHGDQHGQELGAVVGDFFDFHLQLVGHLVEGLREQADFVRGGDQQANSRRSTGELTGGRGHLCERFRKIARHPEAQRHREEKGCAKGGYQILLDMPHAVIDRRQWKPKSDDRNPWLRRGLGRQQTGDIVGAFSGGLAGPDIDAASRCQRLCHFGAGEMVFDLRQPLSRNGAVG